MLGIAFLATAFTAQAWLNSSIEFFAMLGNVVATHIGTAVGLIFLGVTFCFSIENGFQTVASLVSAFAKLGMKAAQTFNEMVEHPGEFFKKALLGCLNGVKHKILHPLELLKDVVKTFLKSFFVIHIVGSSAVTSQGAEAFALQGFFGPDPLVNKLGAGVTELLEEASVDLYHVFLHKLEDHHHDHPAFPHFHQYHHHHEGHQHADHEHGDLWKYSKKGVREIKSGVEALLTKLGVFAKPVVEDKKVTKLVPRVGIAPKLST